MVGVFGRAMTDAKPQEFARVDSKGTIAGVEYGILIVGGISVMVMDADHAESYASSINAAVAAHVRRSVDEDRQWVAKRLIAWAKGKEPANTAFTSGELRDVAYAVEEKVRRAVEEFRERLRSAILENEPPLPDIIKPKEKLYFFEGLALAAKIARALPMEAQ